MRNLKDRVRKYGITTYQAREMLSRQEHACALCKQPISFEVLFEAAIDHSHSTGKVRGILCAFCNKALKYWWHLRPLQDRIKAYLGDEKE